MAHATHRGRMPEGTRFGKGKEGEKGQWISQRVVEKPGSHHVSKRRQDLVWSKQGKGKEALHVEIPTFCS